MQTVERVRGQGVREREVTVAGVRSPLIEAGATDAPEAVVFVHGNPGSSGEWRRLVQQTGNFARALAFDLPGFGQAGKPDDFDYSVAGYAQHIERVLDHLEVERAHLVLHDFGGAFGLRWALEHRDRLASLSLLNIGVLPGYRWHYLGRIWRTPVLGELFQATTTRPAMRRVLGRGNPRGLPAAFFDELWRNYDAGTRRAVLRLYRATPPREIHEASAAAIEAFRGSDVPALVLWGKHDPYLSYRFAERQREAFPDARVHVLEDSGHWPHVDNPDAVAGLMLPFLQRHSPRLYTSLAG